MKNNPEQQEQVEAFQQERLDRLKRHPFSVKTLEEFARFLTGDKTLRVTPIKGKDWKYVRKTNQICVPARHLQEAAADRKDGLQVLGILLHEIGHHKFTDFSLGQKIVEKARALGLPEKAFHFLDNAVEDPRVNQLMMTEEQAKTAIDYVYEIDWSKRSVDLLPTVAQGVSEKQKEALQRARYKQFGYNIIYYWRHKDFMPGTSEEVKAALLSCLGEISKAIYAHGLERFDAGRHTSLRSYYKARAELAHTLITTDPIWSVYVELVKKDIEELGNVEDEEPPDEMPPGMPEDEDDDLPQEDRDEYHPQDMETKEGKNEPPYLFKMEPAPKESYFPTGVRSHFDPAVRRWRKEKRLIPYETPEGLSAIHTLSGKVRPGIVALPLPKGSAIDLESLEHEGGNIEVSIDQHGVVYFKSDEVQPFSVRFGANPDFGEDEATEGESKPLFGVALSGKTEAVLAEAEKLPPREAAKKLEELIKGTKKYNVGAQGKLYKSATNADTYFRRIDQAKEVECYTANTFLVGLCRRIGIPARLIGGDHVAGAKDNVKKITRQSGHAWAEIWDGSEWVRMDATPPGSGGEGEGGEGGEEGEKDEQKEDKKDPKDLIDKDAEGASGELEKKMDEISEKEAEDLEDSEYEDQPEQENKPGEKKEGDEKRREAQFEELKESPSDLVRIFESGLEATRPHAEAIIEALTAIQSELDIQTQRRRLFERRRKKQHGLAEGTAISTRQQVLAELLIGGSRVLMRNRKLKPHEEPKAERLDCEFAMAIDLSGSMGSLAEDFRNFESLDKKSHAFLSALTLLQVGAYFNIPCHIVVFADKAMTLDPKEGWFNPDQTLNAPVIVKSLVQMMKSNVDAKGGDVGGGNNANRDGMRKALESLKESKTKRQLAIVLSDGDGDKNQFLSDTSREALSRQQGLYVMGLGLGQDASGPTDRNYLAQKLSVIESQFHSELGQGGFGKTKGLNVLDFKGLVPVLKKELFDFLAKETVSFKTFEDK